MDKEMSEREAFEAWLPGKIIPVDEYTQVREEGFYVVWQAACKWQREKDAEICLSERVDVDATESDQDEAYNTALVHAHNAILNQGGKE